MIHDALKNLRLPHVTIIWNINEKLETKADRYKRPA